VGGVTGVRSAQYPDCVGAVVCCLRSLGHCGRDHHPAPFGRVGGSVLVRVAVLKGGAPLASGRTVGLNETLPRPQPKSDVRAGGLLTTHEQVWIRHLEGTGALVDVGIAPTIKALWVAGVDTSFSCQGAEGGWRYVVVRSTHRFVAADVLARLGERLVDQHGNDWRWVFQLSNCPLSLLPHGHDWMTTTYPGWDLP
jgi:hypothetical protein